MCVSSSSTLLLQLYLSMISALNYIKIELIRQVSNFKFEEDQLRSRFCCFFYKLFMPYQRVQLVKITKATHIFFTIRQALCRSLIRQKMYKMAYLGARLLLSPVDQDFIGTECCDFECRRKVQVTFRLTVEQGKTKTKIVEGKRYKRQVAITSSSIIIIMKKILDQTINLKYTRMKRKRIKLPWF